MKNISKYIMVSAIFLFIGIMLGIFFGRNSGSDSILLTQANSSEINTSSPTTAYYDEVLGRININSATVDELTSVPGIGSVTAQRIVEYRRKYGKFYSINDLLKIKGISETTLDDIRPYITVGG